jgi:hypothetical protein
MQPSEVVSELTSLLRARIGDRDLRERDRTLKGLREVRDPAMLPFFAQLSINPSPQLRAHGLLGLAELEPKRGLDLLAVSRITDSRLQGVVVSEAVAAGLVGDDTRSELTSWASLPIRVRLDLAAACAARSRPFDVAGIQGMLTSTDGFTSVAAAVVLKQAGAAMIASDMAIRTRAAGLAQVDGAPAAELAEFVVEHNLTSAGPALDTVAVLLKPGAAFDAVAAARLLTKPDSAAAVSAAISRLDITVPLPERTAFAVRLLDVSMRLGKRTPRAVLAEMESDPDPLIKAIAQVGEAFQKDEGVGAAAAALARRGNLPTVAWALRCAAERHWQDAGLIRVAVIQAVAKRTPGSAIEPQLAEMATAAAASLCDDDPRALDRPLAEALSAADGPLVRIILEGALRGTHDGSGALVRQGTFEPRPAGPWPSAETASLALLVAVRHQEFTAVPVERIERLTAIARGEMGGSGLSSVVRAQAAWLALRDSGEDRVALTRILSDLPTPSADTAVPPVAPPSTLEPKPVTKP